MNQFGTSLRISIFGESHGPAIGAVLDGVPPGLPVDTDAIQARMDARRPGVGPLVSSRNEADVPEILSGVYQGKTTGAPIAFIIRNEDTRSKDYSEIVNKPRPGHSDHIADVWSRGHYDPRGGGHYSGRLTACLVAAAAIVQPMLEAAGISVAAHLTNAGAAAAGQVPDGVANINHNVAKSAVHAAGDDADILAAIQDARAAKDSVGGIVAWLAEGMPIAAGAPFFDSIESKISHLLFAVPAVKGVEFGEGFGAAAMRGSEHNDGYTLAGDQIVPSSNHAGGILGGRSTGAPIFGRVAIKPTSSIFQPQQTVDKSTRKPATLELKGRHDPCIAIRAVPVVRACIELVLADLLLIAKQEGHA